MCIFIGFVYCMGARCGSHSMLQSQRCSVGQKYMITRECDSRSLHCECSHGNISSLVTSDNISSLCMHYWTLPRLSLDSQGQASSLHAGSRQSTVLAAMLDLPQEPELFYRRWRWWVYLKVCRVRPHGVELHALVFVYSCYLIGVLGCACTIARILFFPFIVEDSCHLYIHYRKRFLYCA